MPKWQHVAFEGTADNEKAWGDPWSETTFNKIKADDKKNQTMPDHLWTGRPGIRQRFA
jgi:hypothetical protein